MTNPTSQSPKRLISSSDELVTLVGEMQVSSIKDFSDAMTIFSGTLEDQGVLITFDFHHGHGTLTVLTEPEKQRGY